jgi:hypothetical protein
MKYLFLSFIVFSFSTIYGQSVIDWSEDYELELSDFQSPQTEINKELNSYSVSGVGMMEFAYQMSSYEFMFTKNFNDKVKNRFHRDGWVILASDTTMALQLVNYAQYLFDLSELYARKFRLAIYEGKGTFSNVSYMHPIFDQLQREMTTEEARVQKLTDLGMKEELLNAERLKVRLAIDELAEFCETCKPSKRSRKK